MILSTYYFFTIPIMLVFSVITLYIVIMPYIRLFVNFLGDNYPKELIYLFSLPMMYISYLGMLEEQLFSRIICWLSFLMSLLFVRFTKTKKFNLIFYPDITVDDLSCQVINNFAAISNNLSNKKNEFLKLYEAIIENLRTNIIYPENIENSTSKKYKDYDIYIAKEYMNHPGVINSILDKDLLNNLFINDEIDIDFPVDSSIFFYIHLFTNIDPYKNRLLSLIHNDIKKIAIDFFEEKNMRRVLIPLIINNMFFDSKNRSAYSSDFRHITLDFFKQTILYLRENCFNIELKNVLFNQIELMKNYNSKKGNQNLSLVITLCKELKSDIAFKIKNNESNDDIIIIKEKVIKEIILKGYFTSNNNLLDDLTNLFNYNLIEIKKGSLKSEMKFILDVGRILFQAKKLNIFTKEQVQNIYDNYEIFTIKERTDKLFDNYSDHKRKLKDSNNLKQNINIREFI